MNIPSSKARQGRSLLSLISLSLFVGGCDDISVIHAYEKSEVQIKAENDDFEIGDPVFSDVELTNVCFVAPLNDLTEYSDKEWKITFSESFWLVVKNVDTDEEAVERVHKGWLRTADNSSFCSDDAQSLIVGSIVSGQLNIDREID